MGVYAPPSDRRQTAGLDVAALLSISSSLLVGLALVVAPWCPAPDPLVVPSFWESNYLLPPHPTLREWVLSAFTRGAVSGLGFVNILLAFAEIRQHLAERIERF